MKCPKCGNEWICDYGIVGVEHRKHWYDLVPIREPFHIVYPEKPRYKCIQCKYEWGEWK